MQMRAITILLAASIFVGIVPSIAMPVSPNHPIVGTWKIAFDLPEGSCDEIYSIHLDGTTRATSGEELSQSKYDISDQPNDSGFYKWVDTVTKTNGKPDCHGNVTRVGDVATAYVIFHRSGDKFLLCVEPSVHRCIGPYVRQRLE